MSAVVADRSRSASSWGLGDGKTVRLGAILTGVLLGNAIVCLQVLANRGAYPFGDFFAIWTYAKVAVGGRAADLYDLAQAYSAELALGLPTTDVLGVAPSTLFPFPFPYPPTFLIMLWPLGSLSYAAAFAAWVGVTLPLYALAICHGMRFWPLLLLGVAVAPTTMMNISFGQSGFLLAALLVGGLRIMDRRPVLAGILFGLLTYKPQFALLLPIALVASGQWRCIAAACATGAALVASATLAFGGWIWMTWLRSLPAYADWAENVARCQYLRASVQDNLRLLGAPPILMLLVQAAAIAVAGGAVWVAFRRGSRDLAVLVLIAASCLAAPHSMIYDFPMLTGAALLFLHHRLRSKASLSPAEMGIVLVTFLFPIALAWSIPLPVSSALPALFLALVLVRRRQEAVDAAPRGALA